MAVSCLITVYTKLKTPSNAGLLSGPSQALSAAAAAKADITANK